MARVSQGFQACLSWIKGRQGEAPDNAVEIGNGIFVGRMHQAGDLIPGKVVARNYKGYVAYGGNEHEHSRYEVLCDTSFPGTPRCYRWVSCRDGRVENNTLVGGRSSSGDAIYVARTRIDGEWVGGKVQEGMRCGHFPHGGKEHEKSDYEVLVVNER